MTEVKSTDDCECTDLEGGMNSYISLEAELEDWFEKPYDELPKDLRKRVDRSFRPLRPPLSQKEQQKREEQQMRAREKQTLKEYQKREEQQKDELKRTREKQRKKAWDNHTPDDRRKRACLWDGWENPAFERERRRLWDLGLLKDMHKVKEEIEKWETTPHLSISELESKERHIEELNNELQTIEENISDGFEREERLAAELIAAEIEAYAEHDRIAAEKRAEEQRLEAIEQEDNNSLPKMGGVARGVQYDRLEQQAIKLYREGQFKSKLQASKDLYQQIKIHVYNENFKIPAPKASTIYRWLLKLN